MLRAKKPSTSDGKKRKERILDRLFYQHKKTILQVRFYQASMHKMKSFVLKYQPKEPLTHQLHYDLSQLAREFLVKFVEPKCLKGVAPKNLRDLNLTESMNNRVRTGYGILEKLWNFEKEIPYMEKLWNLSKTVVPMEKLWNFRFGGKKCVLSLKKGGKYVRT